MLTRPLISAALAALLLAPPASAGLGDAIKKAGKKATDAVEGSKPAAPAAPTSATEGEKATKGESSGDKVSTVSTKFDYIPGDSVLFLDDFTGDELGEFPHQWSLAQGNFETAELAGERWLRGVGDDGRIRLKLPITGPLPELWTLEFDILGQEPMDQAFIVRALGDDEKYAWESTFPSARNVVFRSGSIFSSTPLEGTVPGRHHLAFMARGKTIKAYIDRQRFASVPEIDASAGPPQAIEIRMFSSSKPMITNVRFALGPKPAKDLLASGRLVTHGIHFETGSDVVLPDSAPILRQVAAWMTANPAAKLKVTGHTDNVGSAASNLDLSKRRAASVARVLSGELGVAADRFETDGKGDTQAMASNAKPEGRAMNRRVEFAKP
jgi:hypothetical protein